jgi:hypothetical protein
MPIADIELTVTTEDGTQKMPYSKYAASTRLRRKFGRQATAPAGRQTLFLGPYLFSYPDAYLAEKHDKRRMFEEARRMYEANPLKYFFPQADVVVDYLNWGCAENTLKVFHSGVGTGKTVCGAVDWLLDIVPTQPDWPIFQFGVKPREQQTFDQGGVGVITYLRQHHQNVLWPQAIARWCPREHIVDYLTGKKKISWRENPKAYICDTPLFFMVSSQKEEAFVSMALDRVHWDEQHGESKFRNVHDRISRRGGRHIMTMTPHRVEGRAETGAGSFIDLIRKGEMDTALEVKFFQCSKADVVDWVVPKEQKDADYRECIEIPTEAGDTRRLAEGRSKFYGDFHESSGLVLDNYDEKIHVIEPFDIPEDWTFYRYHDHGRMEPNACLLVAVTPDEDYIIVDEYYVKNVEIADAAKGIVGLCGNAISDMDGGWRRENMTGKFIRYTLSDPRSLSKRQDNSERTIQEEYERNGLRLEHGTGQTPTALVPLVTALLEPTPERKHIVTGATPAPQLYVFATCTNTRQEARNWRLVTKRIVSGGGIRTVEKPEASGDHAMTCIMQLAADRPVWVPVPKKGVDMGESDRVQTQSTCKLTGF